MSVGKLLYYEVRREGPEAVEGELGGASRITHECSTYRVAAHCGTN